MVHARTSLLLMSLLIAACASTSPGTRSAPDKAAAGGEPASPKAGGQAVGGRDGEELAAKPVGSRLMRDVVDSPKTFEVRPNDGKGHGLGQFSVAVDGRDLWPPAGPGCEVLVRCCTELTSANEYMALACLLAVGRDGDCRTALGTTSAIAKEGGQTPPASCPTTTRSRP